MGIVGTAESLFKMRLYAICCTGTFRPHYLMAHPPALHSFVGLGLSIRSPSAMGSQEKGRGESAK